MHNIQHVKKLKNILSSYTISKMNKANKKFFVESSTSILIINYNIKTNYERE